MVDKRAVTIEGLPDASAMFSWGLRVSAFDELYFVTGLADQEHPGDPVAQTTAVLGQLDELIVAGGYSLDHVVRMEWTFRTDVTNEHYRAIRSLWAGFLAPMAVKPAGGTLRYVERLANPAIMVEYELLLAR